MKSSEDYKKFLSMIRERKKQMRYYRDDWEKIVIKEMKLRYWVNTKIQWKRFLSILYSLWQKKND